ncbi:MAG: crosslink repair DNA glycosylase YcaQ family protein [Acholeplasmataceae bacterium]|nr:crosslink repair DNA glycosylase YcaQ family protein [Acholeplasmataceae bacterium]
METIKLSKEELKSFLITYQGLTYPSEFQSEEGIINLFRRIGSIQYDPLNVIGKNADLVLQSRIPDYKENTLSKMLYQDRTLIDGWDKMMSIYLTEDFPYFHHIRREKDRDVQNTLNYRKQISSIEYIDHVLDYIKAHGPSYPKDMDLGSIEGGVWGHGKVSSVVCDYLWNIGVLGIVEKKNVIKKYDFIENIIDPSILNQDPVEDMEDFLKWYVLRRIGSIGIYWSKSGPGWYNHFIYKESLRKPIIKSLLEENKLTLVKIDGMKEDFYIRTTDIPILKRPSQEIQKVKFIAPLDNLLWDRKFLYQIFDFDYTWEVYVPEAKRKYGYYVIPVLYGNDLIARFEPSGKRSLNDFSIKNWWWEDHITPTNEMINEIIEAFNLLTKFLGADKIDIENIKEFLLGSKK